MRDFGRKLEAAKRASTAQLLFKCARLLNERAIATLPVADETRPRAAHMALFPHVDLEHGTRLTTLADKLGVSKQAVAQLVDDLEAMGVMARVPDPDDGRAKRVVFTDKGRAAML
ncbi:MAG: winged helix DNA-binding protein, partial [Myxococcales bacterium]|nr:winged helix DNA-binding protein [Myxococcales bacterium]